MDFTCTPCRLHHTEQSSLKEELQSKLMAGLEQVLADLLSSSSTQHLLLCKEVRRDVQRTSVILSIQKCGFVLFKFLSLFCK